MDSPLLGALMLAPALLLTLATVRDLRRGDGFDGLLMLGACGVLWFISINAIVT